MLSRRLLARVVRVNRIASFGVTNRTMSTRLVNQTSWAHEALETKGEKFADPVPFDSMVVLTEATLSNPSEKVKALAEEVLSLSPDSLAKVFTILETRTGFPARQMYQQVLEGGVPAGDAGEAGDAAAAEAPKEEKTVFSIKLGAVDAKAKIKVIKEVRTITGLGLKEAKELVEKAPVMLKEGLKKEEAENFMKILKEAGAESTLE